MTSTKKSTSVYLYVKNQPLPFPSLKAMQDNLIPLYDFQESLELDYSKFNSLFGFVKTNAKNKINLTIAMAVLSAFFGVASIILTVFYCIKIRP